MPYRNKSLKRINEQKLRFSDYELEDLNNAMDIHGGETAVWIRELVNAEVQRIIQFNELYDQEDNNSAQLH